MSRTAERGRSRPNTGTAQGSSTRAATPSRSTSSGSGARWATAARVATGASPHKVTATRAPAIGDLPCQVRGAGDGTSPDRTQPVCCNGLMQFNTYTVAGAHIAAWLVNHPSPEAPAVAAVLDSYDVHQPATTTAQMRALRPWTGRLRGVFEAGTVAEKAERADSLLMAAHCRPRLVSHGAGLPFHLH